MGPQLGSRFQNFLIFSIFFLGKFFFKGKTKISKVVHLTIKMISILTLSQKRKCQLFRDPNCGRREISKFKHKIVSVESFCAQIRARKDRKIQRVEFQDQTSKTPLFCTKHLENYETRSIERHFSLFSYRLHFETHISVHFFVINSFFRSTNH